MIPSEPNINHSFKADNAVKFFFLNMATKKTDVALSNVAKSNKKNARTTNEFSNV